MSRDTNIDTPPSSTGIVLAVAAVAIVLGAGASWAAPADAVPGQPSLEALMWVSWWLAALTGLRASAALVLARAAPRCSGRKPVGDWSLRLAPRFVRPLVMATLWAGLQAPPVGAQEPTGPITEYAVMRRVDNPEPTRPGPEGPAPADVEPAPALDTPIDTTDLPITGSVTVEAGDHIWNLASEALADHLGREPRLIELTEYWLRVIEANRAHLFSGDPNLIHPGESIRLPPLTPAGP
ncbi:MAG: hypothetical protein GY929_21925 [Actinomycetia bacterium]|nr:hypothetical protein [Actinomycetes bacterium]